MDNAEVSASTPATRWIVRFCALLVLGGGCVSALGWIGHMPRLADWGDNGISIKFNATLCVIMLSLGLLFGAYYPRYRTVVRVLGTLVALIAAASLVQTIFGVNFGIDTVFFNEAPGAAATVAPGRMGPPEATALMLLGAATILGTVSWYRNAAAMLIVTALCIATLSLAGYAYDADELYILPHLSGIALQTAMMIAALAVGFAASIPERGIARAILRKDGGGVILRHALPTFILVVLLFSRFLLVGVRNGYLEPGFAAAIRTLFEVVLLGGVLAWTARRVTQMEKTSRAAANALARSQMQQRIAETQEAERKRISRDLHDDIGQEVTGVRFALERLCDGTTDMPQMVAAVNTICGKMKKLDGQITNIAWQLRPPDLEKDGIVASIRRLGMECTAIHEMAFDLHAPGDLPDLPMETQGHIYRIAQESMNNIVKHAKATRIGVTLDRLGGDLRLTVEDDGIGFSDLNPSMNGTDTRGFGLAGMRERATIVGGTFEIESTPGTGTTILVRIPLVADQQLSSVSATHKLATL